MQQSRGFFMVFGFLGIGLLLMGCATKGVIVYGESFNSTAEAVREAQAAVTAAESFGCRAKSIGDGVGGPSLEGGGGVLVSIPVLLRCPVGTPELLAATGQPVP